MKKITLLLVLFVSFCFTGYSQCLTSPNGQYPATTFTPNGANCNGITVQNITTAGWGGEYSVVAVTIGQTYVFSSSVATDIVTISADAGATAATFGTGSVTWVSTVTGDIRFYTHIAACAAQNVSRTRRLICGVATCTQPAVTYAKVTNCPTATFNVTANITSLGSATSITVSDNQASPTQQVTATGLVTFGPYANGTSVVLTATNDQDGTCSVVSTAQTQVQCPPANDDIANALPVACGGSYTESTTYATLDQANPVLQFAVDLDSPNVWYTFTGTGNPETVTVDLCASAYDTSVLIFTGTPGSLTAIAGNDDYCGVSGFRSSVNFNSNGTTTYYIVVEGYDPTSTGAYTMAVSCVATNPPAVPNQDCATALTVNVDGLDTNSDNSFGTVSPDQPTCDLFGSIQDVWFKFVAPVSGTVDCLITNGTMTSLNFNVYSGASCAGLTAVAGTCNANLTVPTTESLTGLISGDTYYVQVWSNAAEQGTFTMKLSDALVAPSFDKTGLTVYPNPVKDMLNLSYTRVMSNVSIHNLLGQTVMSKNIDGISSQLDLSKLANGTYLVKVTVDDLIQTIKIVKE